jgi:hypothetical protein
MNHGKRIGTGITAHLDALIVRFDRQSERYQWREPY